MDEKAKLIKDYARMCKIKIGIDCDECELNKNKKYSSCELFMMKEPEKAVEIIEKWSAEHPVKTRQDKLLEQYPDFKIGAQGIVNLSPCVVEPSRFVKDNTSPCAKTNMTCQECKWEYWMEEVE